jgi:hypothetical protein
LADIRRQMAGWGSEQLTGHVHPPAPVPLLLADRAPVPRMATMVCGGCGGQFAADPAHVMVLLGWPCCLTCWDKRNYLRSRTGLPVQGRPPCYPEDYQRRQV